MGIAVTPSKISQQTMIRIWPVSENNSPAHALFQTSSASDQIFSGKSLPTRLSPTYRPSLVLAYRLTRRKAPMIGAKKTCAVNVTFARAGPVPVLGPRGRGHGYFDFEGRFVRYFCIVDRRQGV